MRWIRDNHGNGRPWSILGLLALAMNAQAANWDIVPRLLVNETYSDNVSLRSDNINADYITQVTPGLSIRGQGGRIELNLDYNLQKLMYARDNDFDSMNHQLQATGSAELYEQVLFLDVSSQISQQLISTTGVISDNNLNATGNRSDVMSYKISPYIRHHFGGYADALGRFERSQVFNDAQTTSASGSTSEQWTLNLNSGRYFRRMPWSLNTSTRKVSNETGAGDSEFRNIEARVSYVFNRKYRLTSVIGNDDNSFATSRGQNSGSRFEIGGAWTPSPRTSVEMRIGKQYFGRTFFMDASHKHRRFLFKAHYDERTETLNDVQTSQVLIPLVDSAGNPVFDPNASSNIVLPTDTPGLLNDVLVNKRLDINIDYSKGRNRAGLGVYTSSREYQASNRDESTTGFRVSFSRQLSEYVTASVNGDWTSSDFQNGARSDSRYGLGANISRRFGRHMNGTLDYRYRQSDSDASRNNYTENRLSASLNLYY